MPKLTPKQERFVDEYLTDLNATQAAVRAGYSKKTANRTGTKLLSNAVICIEIQKRRKDVIESIGITRNRIIQEMACLAFFSGKGLVSSNGAVIPLHELTDEVAAAINGVDFNPDGTVKKYRIPDKNKALENLARILGYMDREGGQSNTAPRLTYRRITTNAAS